MHEDHQYEKIESSDKTEVEGVQEWQEINVPKFKFMNVLKRNGNPS